jgi:hypothetical protein
LPAGLSARSGARDRRCDDIPGMIEGRVWRANGKNAQGENDQALVEPQAVIRSSSMTTPMSASSVRRLSLPS